jgi:nucleotide-binding universal stress UspA family protein
MATHGRGSLAPLWLGSVADYLLRTVSVPILLVRPSDVPCWFRAVLVPTDFSADSLAILEPVTRFARLTQAHVTLLHVVGLNGQNGGPPYRQRHPPDAVPVLTADAQHRLDQLADRLRADGLRAAARVVAGRDIAGTILAQIGATPADFLALTTHGAGGFRDRLLGSVADKVIRSSTAPVLVLRPPVRQ